MQDLCRTGCLLDEEEHSVGGCCEKVARINLRREVKGFESRFFDIKTKIYKLLWKYNT